MMVYRGDNDNPATAIELIGRILGEPQRAFTLALLVGSVVPETKLTGFLAFAVHWGMTVALGLSSLRRGITCSGTGRTARGSRPRRGRHRRRRRGW
jgi:hypothetical protein